MKDVPENCWKCDNMDGTFDMWFCEEAEKFITAPYTRPEWCPKERKEEKDVNRQRNPD